MVTPVNEIDVHLQAEPQRTLVSRNGVGGIILSTTSNVVTVDGAGTGTPGIITLVATPLNNAGTVTWAASPSVQLNLDSAGLIATLHYSDMGTSSVKVTATLTTDGIPYTDSQTVTQVTIGSLGYQGALDATRNSTTRGPLAGRPTGADGDFYFATDTLVLYQKISGSWQVAGNNFTNTNQLTDGAGLGNTALWAGVGNMPVNLAGLIGDEGIVNSQITINADGTLSGAGAGQVTQLPVIDTRSTNAAPSAYGVCHMKEFKAQSVIGIPGAGADTYCILETEKGWANATGGDALQWAYISSGVIYKRSAANDATSWGAWVRDLDTSVYTGDLNATNGATWGVNVAGRPQDTTNLVNKTIFEDGLLGTWSGPNAAVASVSGMTFTKAINTHDRDTTENGNNIPVQVGETFYCEAWISTSGLAAGGGHSGNTSLGLAFYDSAGNHAGWAPGVTLSPGTQWTHLAGSLVVPTNAVVSANAVSACPWIQIDLDAATGNFAGGALLAGLRISRYQSGATVGATWGVNVGGDNLPANNATADLSLVGRGVTIIGNTATKSAGTTGWDADCYSQDSFVGGAFASGRLTSVAQSVMFGLNTDPSADSSYASIDFALYNEGSTLYAYESGQRGPSLGTAAVGDILAVVYDGSYVTYLQNGVVRYSHSATVTAPLYFDSSFYDNGVTIGNIRFGPLSSNNWASIGGVNKPADNATVGATLGPGGNVTGKATSLTDIGNAIGTFTTIGTGGKTIISGAAIKIYDGSGALRVRIGDLNA